MSVMETSPAKKAAKSSKKRPLASPTKAQQPSKKARKELKAETIIQSEEEPKKEHKNKENEVIKKKKKFNKMINKEKKLDSKGKKPVKSEDNMDKERNQKVDRKKQKALKLERQEKKKTGDVYSLGVKAKQFWETVRRESCPEEERNKLLQDLHDSIKGQVKKLIFAHDTVRVIECLVAKGSDEIKASLFQELKDDIVDMCKSKYAYFFVVKMTKYGNKEQKRIIYKAFEGRVAQLMKHKIANNAVEMYYNEVATAAERNAMLQEFCGPELKNINEPDIHTVSALMAKYPQKKKDLLRYLGEHVSTLIAKGCYNHSLVHTVIYNYLQVCEPQRRAETIESLRDAVLHILHSHDGSRAGMLCLWHGTTKDRKAIVKSFKGHVTKIACEKQGFYVLLALFDAVDDTKLVGKAILGELAENIAEIVNNETGRKVLHYLLAHRDTKYFHPQVQDILKLGDDNEHSKKPANVRVPELRDQISLPVCKYLASNWSDLMYNNPVIILIGCALTYTKVEHAQCLVSVVVEEVCKPFTSGEENFVETGAGHQMLKKLIAHDKERKSAGSSVLFSDALLDGMDEDSLESLLTCNRGAFLFVNMLDTEIPELRTKVVEKVKLLKKTLQAQTSKGATILKQKLYK